MEEAASKRDEWAEWLLTRRFDDADAAWRRYVISELYRVRDRVLQNASIRPGDVLLDVGAGDGLIAFGAIPLLGASGRVIFSDISQDLLDHSRSVAEQLGVSRQIQFVEASASDLSTLADASVDIVTTRSVLIYVADKDRAFHEFHRVLQPGGRLSIFEPINAFGAAKSRGPARFHGFDVGPVQEIADKLGRLYRSRQTGDGSVDDDPMLNFDERDLLRFAEAAGFADVHVTYEASVSPSKPMRWETVLKMSENPKLPTLEEAMRTVLTESESREFTAYLRPLVESGAGVRREAVVYVWATK
jgi:ubiquinone/menaquinone biosynthesis C-methylase UbiE